MEAQTQTQAITENAALYVLWLRARKRGSKIFFRLTHNMSLDRPWNIWCAPDIDLLEVCADGTVVGYEVKGQRKRKGGYDWPNVLSGLDQAMRYLHLPAVTEEATGRRLFDGGALDRVYLVHTIGTPDALDHAARSEISLTPIGFIGILPMSQPTTDGVPLPTVEERLTAQLDRVIELIPARPNPLQDPRVKQFLLDHLSSLEAFGERSRTFRRIVEPAGMSYFDLLPQNLPVFDSLWRG